AHGHRCGGGFRLGGRQPGAHGREDRPAHRRGAAEDRDRREPRQRGRRERHGLGDRARELTQRPSFLSAIWSRAGSEANWSNENRAILAETSRLSRSDRNGTNGTTFSISNWSSSAQ